MYEHLYINMQSVQLTMEGVLIELEARVNSVTLYVVCQRALLGGCVKVGLVTYLCQSRVNVVN